MPLSDADVGLAPQGLSDADVGLSAPTPSPVAMGVKAGIGSMLPFMQPLATPERATQLIAEQGPVVANALSALKSYAMGEPQGVWKPPYTADTSLLDLHTPSANAVDPFAKALQMKVHHNPDGSIGLSYEPRVGPIAPLNELVKGATGAAEQFITPGNAALVGASALGGQAVEPAVAELINKLVGSYFVSQIGGAAAQELPGLVKQPSLEGLGRVGTELAAAAFGAKGLMQEVPVRPGPTPTEPLTTGPWGQLKAPEVAPLERQLPRFAQSHQEAKTQPGSLEPIQLPQLMSQPRMVVDVAGQAVDLSQLTPKEQTELLRGPRAFVPRQMAQTGVAQPPIVGQRPLTIQQPIVQPGQQVPLQNLGELLQVQMAKKAEPLGGQISFGGEGIPSARQAAQMVPENVIKSREQLSGKKLYAGAPIDPEDLRPAIRLGGRIVLGNKGDTHADVLERMGVSPDTVTHENQARGFASVKEPNRFLNRTEAQDATGIKGTAEAGGLDSMDLPGAAMARLESETLKREGKQNASIIREDQSTLPEARLQPQGSEESRSGGLQQPPGGTEGAGGTTLRQEAQEGLKLGSTGMAQLKNFERPEVQRDAARQRRAEAEEVGQQRPPMELHAGIPIESLRKRERELRGETWLTAPRMLVTPKESGFTDPNKRVDATQLWNRVANKAPVSEVEMMKAVGVDAAIKAKGRVTPLEAAQIMQEMGPRVEVRKFGEGTAGGKVQRELQDLTHVFYDNLNASQRRAVDDLGVGNITEDQFLARGLNHNDLVRARRYNELLRTSGSLGSESAHWSSIAPKPESEMPGYVEGAVVVPQPKINQMKGREGEAQHIYAEKELFPSSHSFPPNTLGFFRGYMETRADGGKTFHVVEVQSDWAQKLRDYNDVTRGPYGERVANHPLLPQWERLTLKAAIDHAKKEGADRIAVQDAESAMMMEGHDRQAREYQVDEGEPGSRELKIPQEKGMRLHYDTILPRLLEEMTGQKGKAVEFGEHKMASEYLHGYEESLDRRQLRKDLIFRTPTGEPKTSVSAREFSLEKVKTPFSMFERDKPASRTEYMYAGAPTPEKFNDFIKEAARRLTTGTGNKLEERPTQRGQPGEPTGVATKVQNFVARAQNAASKADKVLLPMDPVMDMLDGGGGKYDGPLMQYIRKPLDDAFNREMLRRDAAVDPVSELVVKHKMNKQNGERIFVYATTRQKGGTERLLQMGVTQQTIDKIVGGITPAEKAVYGEMRKVLDSQLPQIQSLAKELYKTDVKAVENYFPWQRDWDIVKPEPDQIAQPGVGKTATPHQTVTFHVISQDLMGSQGTKVQQGYTIPRQPGAKTGVRLNAFEVYNRHQRDVAHFLEAQKLLKSLGEVVRSKEFEAKYGDMGQKLVLDWMNNYALQGRSGRRNHVLDALRKNTSVGIIAFRVASQFVHLANVPLAMQRTGVHWYQRGLSEALGEEGQAFLQKHFRETYERGGGEPALVEAQRGPVTQAGFVVQRTIDRYNAQATVLGVYMRRLSEQGKDPMQYATLPVDQKAVQEARVLARRAVASPLYKDVPLALSKGGSQARLFFQFQNTFLDQWSNIRYDFMQAGIAEKNPKLAAQMAVAIAAMMLVETGIKYGVQQGTQAATGYEPRHEESFSSKLFHEALRRVPGMGQAMSAIVYGRTGIPAVDVALETTRTAKTALTTKDDRQRKLATTQAVTQGLELAGVPGVSQASDVLQSSMKAKMYEPREKRLAEFARQKGMPFESLRDRMVVEAQYRKQQPPMSEQQRVSSAKASIDKVEERRGQILKQLTPQTQKWLEANGLRVPGFGDEVSIGGIKTTLKPEELDYYQKRIAENAEKIVGRLRSAGRFDALDQDKKATLFNKIMVESAALARRNVVEAMAKGTIPKQKKRRFSFFGSQEE